ncbi:MAG: STAS domain-containing protein, partial [Terriglobales bacterium]
MPPKTLVVESRAGAREGQQTVHLSGQLTLESVFRFEAVLRENKTPVTIVDLSLVTLVDSAGLGAIVMAHVSHQRAGRRLALVGVNERVAKLLTIAGLNPVLTIFET